MHDRMHPRMPHGPMPEPDVEGVDPLSLEVFTAFRAVVHEQKRLMMRMLSEEGVHPAQSFCLGALAREDGMSQSKIAEMMHVSRPTVTSMLQRLEAAGVIERRDDETDQRMTRVYLTEKGRQTADRMRAVHTRAIKVSVGWMSEADRTQLVRILNAISEHVHNAPGDEAGVATEGEVRP
ncbi:MarR family transcriptional regulator [bacterium]|nr:MarR family transcriptional regulator [bacterium]